MTDYSKPVLALRICTEKDDSLSCTDCPYHEHYPGACRYEAMCAAADAIEALEAEQKKTVTQIFGEEQQEWEEYCNGLMGRIRELKAQLPKRGEWIEDRTEIVCSKCHARFSDEIIFMNRNMENKALKYCPNCGTKMEVQDDKA